MTQEEEIALLRAAAALIERDFSDEFERIYKRIVEVCGKHAFQPNNEIRNVMGHLANVCRVIRTGESLAVFRTGDSVEDAEAEIERARKHVYIAKCDGLTILFLELWRRAKARLLQAEADHDQIFPNLNKCLGAIEKSRADIPIAPTDEMGFKDKIIKDNEVYKRICDRLELLVINTNTLLCDIEDGCPAKRALLSHYPRIRKALRFWRHHPLSASIAGGIIATSIVYFTTEYLLPDFFDQIGSKLAKWLREIFF